MADSEAPNRITLFSSHLPFLVQFEEFQYALACV